MSINIGVNRDTDLPVEYIDSIRTLPSGTNKAEGLGIAAPTPAVLKDPRKMAARKYALSNTKSSKAQKIHNDSIYKNSTLGNDSSDNDDVGGDDNDSKDEDYIPEDSD
jgi:hypothetical protein